MVTIILTEKQSLMQMFCEVDTTYLPFSNCYHFATKHEQKKKISLDMNLFWFCPLLICGQTPWSFDQCLYMYNNVNAYSLHYKSTEMLFFLHKGFLLVYDLEMPWSYHFYKVKYKLYFLCCRFTSQAFPLHYHFCCSSSPAFLKIL